ncbi:hypothetical protein FB451DRAFT_1360597 [Mycena latifolia]|nr:hypothetical protein FB451DRAFT_1360597 [Mycena latifolia]
MSCGTKKSLREEGKGKRKKEERGGAEGWRNGNINIVQSAREAQAAADRTASRVQLQARTDGCVDSACGRGRSKVQSAEVGVWHGLGPGARAERESTIHVGTREAGAAQDENENEGSAAGGEQGRQRRRGAALRAGSAEGPDGVLVAAGCEVVSETSCAGRAGTVWRRALLRALGSGWGMFSTDGIAARAYRCPAGGRQKRG